MEKYTVLEVLGEGSYGKVLKCRHDETGSLVAIKKFIETEEDVLARKVALREIRMLKKLHHPNLVGLLEVFRRKKRFHLVFEYMCCSLLEELETQGKLPGETARRYMYQILRGVDYCHSHNVIHRDIKPENILISGLGLVKLCDFGFARSATLTSEPFTDYVATRWYRPPELLVGEVIYGRAVDIWALGCILIEMLTGDPLFPGESDIDQLYKITKLLGSLTEGQKKLVDRAGGREPGDLLHLIRTRLRMDPVYCLRDAFPGLERRVVEFVAACLRVDPESRPTSDVLLRHSYFTCDLFLTEFLPELAKMVQLELASRVPVSGLPCPGDRQHFLSAMPIARKPRYNTAWSITMISDGSPDEPSIYKEFIEERKSTMCRESDKAPGKSASHSIQRGKPTVPEKSPLGKLSLPYKRNMMPSTQSYLKPVRGRLLYDKLLALPCDSEGLDRPPSEAIYLPFIKTTERKLINDKKNAQQLKRKKSSSIDIERTKSQKEGNNDEYINSEDGKSSYISLPYYHFPGT